MNEGYLSLSALREFSEGRLGKHTCLNVFPSNNPQVSKDWTHNICWVH